MRRVKEAAKKAGFRNIGHAAASLRKDAIASIKPAPKIRVKRKKINKKGRKVTVTRSVHVSVGSRPGSPPYTRKGKIKRGILYHVDKDSAVIGPVRSKTGTHGTAHEFGGKYKKQSYPERPFMNPALVRAAPRFAESFRGSIGS